MTSSFEILRKLTPKEIQTNARHRAHNFSIVARIRTKIDLYANLYHVETAIRTLKQMHIFLNAQVRKIDNEYFFVKSLNLDFLENVHFLKQVAIEPEANASSEFVLKLLLEKCNYEWIDFEKEHEFLWRMIFLEIDDEQRNTNNEHVYEIIWLFHHVISDGMNANSNLVAFLEIIEKTIKSEKVETRDFGLYAGTENVFKNELKSVSNDIELPKVLRPSFIDPEKARASAFQTFKNQENIDFKLVDVRSNRTYTTFAELIEISKNLNNSKPFLFILKHDFQTIHSM